MRSHDSKLHFQKMRESSEVVIPFIRSKYSDFLSQNQSLAPSVNLFIERRTASSQCLLRPYLVRLAYEVSGGSNWLSIVPACVALEILNISTYQSNLSFDEKLGVDSNQKKNNQFISSMISLQLSVEAILSLSGLVNDRALLKAIQILNQANSEIYVGQYEDLNRLNFKNFNFGMSVDEYLAIYLSRCKNIGGSLISACFEIGAILAGANEQLVDIWRKIGYDFGTAGQIMNDLADFVPQLNSRSQPMKGYQDQYNDVKNGKITYPLFHLFQFGDEQQKQRAVDILTGKSHDLDELIRLTLDLKESGAIDHTKEMVKHYYPKLKQYTEELPQSQSTQLLKLVFPILLTNKFWSTLTHLLGKGLEQRKK